MRKLVLVGLVVALAACSDPATKDTRGYTKAPLEKPGLLVRGEPQSSMGVQAAPAPGLSAEPVGQAASSSGGGETAQPASGSGGQVTLAPGVTQAQYDEGNELFHGVGGCTACHGPNAEGSTLAPNLTDDTWLHVPGPDVDALANLIQQGVPQPVEHPAPMPPMGGANLTQEQVRALAGYVASLSQG